MNVKFKNTHSFICFYTQEATNFAHTQLLSHKVKIYVNTLWNHIFSLVWNVMNFPKVNYNGKLDIKTTGFHWESLGIMFVINI